MSARIENVQVAPPGKRVERAEQRKIHGTAARSGPNFKELLKRAQHRETPGLQFSKHVRERLQQRNITLDAGKMENLEKAVSLAETKGIRDSLILTQHAAYIVNIPNRTVITAVDRDSAENRVFTNIDGAILS